MGFAILCHSTSHLLLMRDPMRDALFPAMLMLEMYGVAELEELVEKLKKLCTSYRPIFSKISKYCFNTSNGTETITVSILFRRLKNTVFTLPGLAILRTLTSSKRTQNRNTPFTTEARVVRKTHCFFFFLLVGQVPLYACAVASVLWESCPVTRSPSCGSFDRQTVEPLPPPTCVVSSSTYLFGWTDHGAVTASSGANTTKMRRQQGRKDHTNKRLGAIWQSFFQCTRLPEGGQKKSQNSKINSIFLWSHNSVGFQVRSSRPSAVSDKSARTR